jgi:hypothetical protein
MLFSEPEVRNRDIVIALKSAKLRVLSGGDTSDICLDSLFSENIETELLTLGVISEAITFDLPKCLSIPVDNGALTATNVCPNDSRDAS